MRMVNKMQEGRIFIAGGESRVILHDVRVLNESARCRTRSFTDRRTRHEYKYPGLGERLILPQLLLETNRLL